MIEYLPLKQIDSDALADLFQREKGALRAHQQAEHLPWSFWQNPFLPDDATAVEIAVENGCIVGAMGVVPQIFLDYERQIQGAFFVDWLVDSRRRRHGVGSALIRNATARYPIGVHLGSTPEGYATCAALGARDCGATQTARRVLRPWQWAQSSAANVPQQVAWSLLQQLRLLTRPRLKTGMTVRTVEPDDVDVELTQLSQQMAQTHVVTLRNAARWNWLMASPLYSARAVAVRHKRRTLGFALLIMGYRQRRLQATVADLIAANVDDAADVLSAALSELASTKAAGISFTVSLPVAERVVDDLRLDVQATPMNGAWLHAGYLHLLDRPWFMTGGENLSVAGGIDYPIRLPDRMQ